MENNSSPFRQIILICSMEEVFIMYTNNFLNIDGKGGLIDVDVLRQEIKKQAKNGNIDDDKANVFEISLSKFEFTHEFVVNIINKRKELNLTQSKLSELANVNRSTISKIESFQRIIVNLDVILRILDALDLKLTITDK